MTSTASKPAAVRPRSWSAVAAENAGLSIDTSETITPTTGAPTSFEKTVCRLLRSSSALPRFIVASIAPIRIGTFCARHDSWYGSFAACTSRKKCEISLTPGEQRPTLCVVGQAT